jgi:hypothetical protein
MPTVKNTGKFSVEVTLVHSGTRFGIFEEVNNLEECDK